MLYAFTLLTSRDILKEEGTLSDNSLLLREGIYNAIGLGHYELYPVATKYDYEQIDVRVYITQSTSETYTKMYYIKSYKIQIQG